MKFKITTDIKQMYANLGLQQYQTPQLNPSTNILSYTLSVSKGVSWVKLGEFSSAFAAKEFANQYKKNATDEEFEL